MNVDGSKTCGRDAAGLYVLNILTENDSGGESDGELILLEEFMIAIEYTSPEANNI